MIAMAFDQSRGACGSRDTVATSARQNAARRPRPRIDAARAPRRTATGATQDRHAVLLSCFGFEMVVYMVRGTDVRHSASRVDKERS